MSSRTLWAAYRVDQLGEAAALCADLADPARLGRIGGVAWPVEPVARLAAVRSLPRWVAAAWIRAFGAEGADALAAASNRPGPITIRARRPAGMPAIEARARLRRVLEEEGQPVRLGRWSSAALHLEPVSGPDGPRKPDIRGRDSWRRGAFEVQDEGSQLAAEAVRAAPGMTVLDLCAGAGGKSLAVLDQLGAYGRLVATDVDPARLADLRGRARRRRGAPGESDRPGGARGRRPVGAGGAAPALEVVRIPPRPEDAETELAARLPTGADRVLVDAPCTSLGTLRRGPARRWTVTEHDGARLAQLQGRLLDLGARLLAPGGRLVYVTCTLGTEENGPTWSDFLRRHRRLRSVPALPDRGPDRPPGPGGAASSVERPLAATVTLRPDRHGTDGFFIAAAERVG